MSQVPLPEVEESVLDYGFFKKTCAWKIQSHSKLKAEATTLVFSDLTIAGGNTYIFPRRRLGCGLRERGNGGKVSVCKVTFFIRPPVCEKSNYLSINCKISTYAYSRF
jgi:hypothetical protein